VWSRYFASFVVLANMMILNLFIGVITTSMAEAKEVLEQGAHGTCQVRFCKPTDHVATEMIEEEQERQRQKRILLGLPTESEADDSNLDEAITTVIDRVQYLLRKFDMKAVKFEHALHNVSTRELPRGGTSMYVGRVVGESVECCVSTTPTRLSQVQVGAHQARVAAQATILQAWVFGG